MDSLKYKVLAVLCVVALWVKAQEAMNTPYADDRVVHFGFSLGLDFGGYSVRESGETIDVNGTNTIVHARTSNIGVGFGVGFITDVRLCRYVNFRVCPTLHFREQSISYRAENEEAKFMDPRSQEGLSYKGYFNYNNDVLIPLDIPLYFKFSAAREGNYRPYVITGGGVSMNVNSFSKERLVATKFLDYFFEIGFGVDTYFRWFKFCPEIKYHIGFNNQLGNPADINFTDYYYMQSISRLTNHVISLTFNFE